MKSIERAIILCWIMLVSCFVIKLLGGNWFEIICTNQNFIRICNFIDAHIVIKYFIAFTVYIPSTYFLMRSVCFLTNPSKYENIVILSSITIAWLSQFIFENLKFIFEFGIFIIIPLLIHKRDFIKKWFWGIIGCALDIGFQLISLITRNIGIKIVDDSILIALILMIDYYIMIALYYLYIKLRKETK